MKKNKIFSVLAICILLIFGTANILYSQTPPPPPGQHDLSGDEPPLGGNAPIGSGSVLLVVMGVLYGTSRISGLRKNTIK